MQLTRGTPALSLRISIDLFWYSLVLSLLTIWIAALFFGLATDLVVGIMFGYFGAFITVRGVSRLVKR
jgi:hypothetical protein